MALTGKPLQIVRASGRLVVRAIAVLLADAMLLKMLPVSVTATFSADISGASGTQLTAVQRHQLEALYQSHEGLFTRFFALLRELGGAHWGTSPSLGVPVRPLVWQAATHTLALLGGALALAVAISIPLGLVMASRAQSSLDRWMTGIAAVVGATPPFVLALASYVALGVKLGWFPLVTPGLPIRGAQLVLPLVTYAVWEAANLTVFVRGVSLPIIFSAQGMFLQANALLRPLWLARYVWPLAMPAVFSRIAAHAAVGLGGVLFVETIFSLPGLGVLTVNAANAADLPLLQGILLVFVVLVLSVTFLAEVFAHGTDPSQ